MSCVATYTDQPESDEREARKLVCHAVGYCLGAIAPWVHFPVDPGTGYGSTGKCTAIRERSVGRTTLAAPYVNTPLAAILARSSSP